MFYHVFISIATIIIAQETFLTNEYGNQNGIYYSTLDQGRISQINNWGVDITGIHIRDWKSDLKTNYDEIYGYNWYHESCPPLNISINDYIIGYKIYVDVTTFYVDEDGDEEETVTMDIIRGLVFYTLNNKNYSCIESVSGQSYSNIYTNYYLSGWNVYSQKVVNSIQFQFTEINPSIPSSIDDDDTHPEATPTPSSLDINAIPTLTSIATNNDAWNDTDSDSFEPMETNDNSDLIIIFSSTVNLSSDSAEPTSTETKYPQIGDDSSDSPSSTSTLSDTDTDTDNTSDPSQSQDDTSDDDTDSKNDQTQTILSSDIQKDDDHVPTQSTQTTTKTIHNVGQDDENDDDKESGSGIQVISQYFNSTQGTVIVVITMSILMFTLILCCVLTLCVINIKRKKRQQEANSNSNTPEISSADDDQNNNNNNDDNDIKLTIPRTLRMGEKSGGYSSTKLSVNAHDLKVSVDGIDGMDGNDTIIKPQHNVNVVDISSLLSPRYQRMRRSTDDGSSWPISPIPRMTMSQGIPIKMSMPHRPPQPLDHPYSIDWTEPQMAKLTDKMKNLFNEEDNRNGSFISTVKIGHNSSRQPSQMTGVSGVSGASGSGNGRAQGSETEDAETDNDTDLMYNHMAPLSESKKTPETKGGDDESDIDKEDEDEDEDEMEDDIIGDSDRRSPFNYIPRRNALKLVTVRSNTIEH